MLNTKKGLWSLLILGAAGLSVAQSSTVETQEQSIPNLLKDDPKEHLFPFEGASLRDPFWVVGYFPTDWGKEEQTDEQKLSTSEWRAPAARLQVNGVSRMGNRVMVLINGSLYSEGDLVEVAHQGKIFQWKIAEINPDGNVRFERHKIITDTPH